jgi:integrase
MSLYKIGSVWHYSFYWGGRRYRGSTKQMQRTKAERIQSDAMAKVREQPNVPLTGRTPLLRELAARFLVWVGVADLEPKTKAYYHNGWRLLSQTRLASIRISDIGEEQIAALRFSGSAASVNNVRRTLRRMLGKAHAWGLAGIAPKIRLQKEKRRTLLINSERETQLLSFARQPLRDVLVIMQDTGLRPDEVLKLRWEHLDWLQETASNPSGKTERARRVVPISERVLTILGQRRTGQNQGWVFPSPTKYSRTGHFSLSTVEHQFVDARRKAGLPEALVLYCARHTYATDALARTGNMAAVMDAMGHANAQTTMIYQHQGLEQIRSAINLRNKENQTSPIKLSPGTEACFGQNPGQSLESDAVAVAVND